MEIEKQTDGRKKNANLSMKQAYQLEKDCLLLLEKNYKCICGLNAHHFPRIISCIDDECKFKMTNCGSALHLITTQVKIIKPKEQIACIIENLKKNEIQHLDMRLSGKNICINPEGILSLIDFDVASIGKKFLSTELRKIFKRMLRFGSGSADYYTSLKHHIEHSINQYDKII